MKIENGEKLLFIGDSVTDDNRARPVGEATTPLWATASCAS
ncbi:MAG: hypothetical protein ACLRSW_13880 [Christensenellaceae bacterium]